MERRYENGGREEKREMKGKRKKPGCRANYREKRGVRQPRARLRALLGAEDDDGDDDDEVEQENGGAGRGWRHGDPALAFNVPHVVRRGYRRGGSGFEEGPGARAETPLPSPVRLP